jgi:SHAQKYF class myb-like DNA-binding protein
MSGYPVLRLAPSSPHEIASETQSANPQLSQSSCAHNQKCHSEHNVQSDATCGSNYNTGRWTSKEKKLFNRGLKIFGKKWNQLQAFIKTRTSSQIRSHAQKQLAKLDKFNIYHYCSSAVDDSSNDSATMTEANKYDRQDEIKD